MKIKRWLFVFWVCLVLLQACSLNSGTDTDTEETYIHLDHGRLYFRGEITELSVRQIFAAVKDYQEPVHKMTVNSTGGEVQSAMKLGRWVFDNHIDLTIDRFCMSSCANYLLTAAQSVHINKNAIVYWHGGATLRGEALSLADIPYFQHSIDMEKVFFRDIGVNQRITDYGQLDDFSLLQTTDGCIKAHQRKELQGWTYTLDDLKKFGVNHVTSDNKKPPVIWEGQMLSCVIPVTLSKIDSDKE
ncbi:hypothetical protein VA7868_01455 [Vibrio aerogenes CECT 7868]|uniref:Clp protease n=1 Tax=Vibrio aerogenes CECT 7868 TaxID=1216006 RepID=A0A1M5Y456_9VIBR|nr:hypothetical protein [Vibrio aerogenes]SHI06283.1 hypothetical protein VA7868_01455 [Vibrio aerogenes CECT 7868]